MRWVQRAADQGYLNAQRELGRSYDMDFTAPGRTSATRSCGIERRQTRVTAKPSLLSHISTNGAKGSHETQRRLWSGTGKPPPTPAIRSSSRWLAVQSPASKPAPPHSRRRSLRDRPSYGRDVGAGDGNRTHVSSLGSCSSTIELHPRRVSILFAFSPARQQLGTTKRSGEVPGSRSAAQVSPLAESPGRWRRAGVADVAMSPRFGLALLRLRIFTDSSLAWRCTPKRRFTSE